MGATEQSNVQQHTGVTALPCIREDNKLNQWIFDTIRPYIKGTPLEIGSGTGNISDLFVRNGVSLYVSNPEDGNSRTLYEKFRKEPTVRGVFKIDLEHPNFENQYAELLGKFNTVFIVNIAEHIPKDKPAIANAKLLLRKRGRLIVLMPASTALFNGLDVGLDQWKRNNWESLRKLLSKDFEILKTQYFNMVGIVGWWLSGSDQSKKKLPAEQLSEYEQLVPLFRIADSMVFKQVGLSVIVVCRKQ